MIVVSAGPERVGSTIREALAKGADRAIHIVCDDLNARDALGVARLLAAAIKPENPDLVLTGLQSEDVGLGQTGVIVAELLGLPHATMILHVEKTDSGLKVKRELEEGWFQSIELPTPAVLTMQSGGNKLRYATLMGIKRAKTKECEQLPRRSSPRMVRRASCSSKSPRQRSKNPRRSCRARPKKRLQRWWKS